MRLFATDTVNSKNYEAEVSLELPNTHGAPFFFKVFQAYPTKDPFKEALKSIKPLKVETEGANLPKYNPSTTYPYLGEETLLTEHPFVPSSNGFMRTTICGEQAQISWEATDEENVFLLKDFHGNEATFNLRTWEIKEILTQEQIERSDNIAMVQEKLKTYVRNNGFNSQDPTLLDMLGALCNLQQHP
jgi:hypothetical protein